MATEPINIPIQTSYDDKGAKEALKDAEKLDDLDPTVDVDVEADTSQAIGDIDEVTDSAKALMERNPWVAEVLADTAAAKGDIDQLQGKLREAGDTADDTGRHLDKIGTTGGPRLAGNQVADLTGPLGDASGAASNFGGIFDGLADISEKVAGKVGLDAEKMASAISGIGFAVAAAAAVWTIYKQEQEKVKKKQQELVDGQKEINKALKDADLGAASKAFIDTYKDALGAADKLGISTKQVVDYITGVSDVAPKAADGMKGFNDSINMVLIEGARKTFDESNDALALQDDKLREVSGSLGTYSGASKTAKDDAKALADEQERAKQKADDLAASFDTLAGNLDVTRAAEDFTADMTQAMENVALGVGNTREEIRGIEDDVVAAAEATGRTPVEVRMELQKVSAGDLAGAKVDIESWYRQHAIEIQVKIASDSLAQIRASLNSLPGINLSGNVFGKSAGGQSASATTVNVNLPRGARAGDISRAMGLSTRRNGRRYGNPSGVVSYARR